MDVFQYYTCVCVVGVEYGLRIIHMIYIMGEYDVWTNIAVAECVVWLG